MQHGAIILCGGQSNRMGRDKASLDFGGEAMLQRIVRLVSQVVNPSSIVVVASSHQVIPELPTSVREARDRQTGRGPLEGFAAGLRVLQLQCDVVFLTSCDSPRLVPEFVERMFKMREKAEIAVPFDGHYEYPLAAVYRTSILTHVDSQLNENRLSLRSLFGKVPTQRVPTDELRDIDPNLTTLENLNSPQDYQRVLIEMGFARDSEADGPRFLR